MSFCLLQTTKELPALNTKHSTDIAPRVPTPFESSSVKKHTQKFGFIFYFYDTVLAKLVKFCFLDKNWTKEESVK